jgi:hypothetical protein
MFGHSDKKQQTGREDILTVQVHAINSIAVFGMAQKIWNENARNLRRDTVSGKELLHFSYANPRCVVWLQRDGGRTDTFELIVRWEENGMHEVYVVSALQPEVGNSKRAQELLHSVLTVPSIVPSTVPNKVQ